jgi:hypothetical protein
MQTVGSFGRLLRIVSYSNNGSFTWTKQPDVGFVVVEVVGGGAGAAGNSNNGTSGTSSSFGSHCSASGGTRSTGVGGGAGGTGSSGDLNLSGNAGMTGNNGFFGGAGGCSTKGSVGSGGNGAISYGGGGAGGYSLKKILSSSLGSTETIIVGNGGAPGAGSASTAGKDGIVIIYEYSA